MSKSRENRQVNSLDAEIEEMEKFFTPQPKDADTTDTVSTTEDQDEESVDDSSDLTSEEEADDQNSDDQDSDNQEDVEDTDDEAPEVKPQAKRKYTDWKTRYKSLRSHHDATIYDLRQELASLKTQAVQVNKQNLELNKQVVSLSQKNTSDGLDLTAEEREVLGDEAIKALSKATQSAVGPLKRQLDDERHRRIQEQEESAKRLQEDNKRLFVDRFAKLVPNYVEIDKDQNFLKFMEQVDPASGYDRVTLFRKSVANGDVVRAAGFYKEYLDRLKLSKSHLASKVTPTGNNTDTSAQRVKTQGKQEVISRKYIDQYYDDVIRGRYKGKESLATEIELKIEKAISEGRVR